MFRKTEKDAGLATAAIVLIAAVVIGGGVLLATSGSSQTEVDTDDSDSMMEEDSEAATEVTYSSEDGEELMVEFMANETVQVTLPNGEVKVVSRVRSASGAKYDSAEGDFTFWEKGDEATVFQNDEITFEGTAMGEAEGEAMMEGDAEATSSTEGETMMEDEEDGAMMEVEVEAGAEGEATAQ